MTSRQLAAACAALPLALVAASSQPPRDRALPPAAGARFAISFPAARSAAPLDGRVLLMLSTDTTAEPRFQISDGPNTQLIFGIDVEGLRPGQDAVIDAGAFGYPLETRYIKHERIQSKLLTEFWGRPTHLGAHVLLPAGFDEHPNARYPLVIFHGHFPSTIEGFREEPPDANVPCEYSERFHLDCYNRIQQEYAYQLYKDWTGPGFPRVLMIEIQHPTPYYDDSYAVNSENNGPYGDAIMRELVPYIERKYRGIGQGWARFTYGGSTGGWEAMAVQMFYPDDFNGAWIACPDPIDFRAYTVVDIYADTNAYYETAKWKRTPRPGIRDWLGHVHATLEQMNHRELVLGTHSRSGDQWDIWESVYSPVGPDGYPKRIWDKRTGTIDRSVADYWREHYHLSSILRRDWKTLRPQLRGKVHIYR